ncbi:hypothetical protein RUND412_010030 [Rhizina undulata]
MGIHDITSNVDEIVPNLFLTEQNIISRNITHVVSIFEGRVNLPSTNPPLKQLHIRLNDYSSEDILGELSRTTDFIREALDGGGRVVVHCLMGISRSPTVVAAYLIATKGLSAGEAVQQVKNRRGRVCPNMGFLLQLEDYSTLLKAEQEENRKKSAERDGGAGAVGGKSGVDGGVTADGPASVKNARLYME